MTRTDSFVVGTLVVLLAIVAGLIGVPALQTALAPVAATARPGVGGDVEPSTYVEGAIGAPVSVSPLTARTQVDRDLVALVFSGLVRNGPGGTIVPDLAESWSVDPTGRIWTVVLRDDAPAVPVQDTGQLGVPQGVLAHPVRQLDHAPGIGDRPGVDPDLGAVVGAQGGGVVVGHGCLSRRCR